MKKEKPMPPVTPMKEAHTTEFSNNNGTRNSRESISVFKRFSLSLSRKSSRRQPREPREQREPQNTATLSLPPGAFPGSASLEYSNPSSPNDATRFPVSPIPVFPTPPSEMVLDISRSSPVLNMDQQEHGDESSDEERSFERHIRNVSSTMAFVPSDSTQTITNTETTAINEVPLNFPKYNTFPPQEPFPPTSYPFQRPTRARSLVERSRPISVHFERTRPLTRADTTVLGATERIGHTSLNNYDPFKRSRRVTMASTSASKYIHHPSLNTNLPSPLPSPHHGHFHEEVRTAERGIPITDDPYANLFTSCAISLFLLIILAAGKDILYLLALLPFLSALVRHVPEFDSIRTAIPLVKRNLQHILNP